MWVELRHCRTFMDPKHTLSSR